MVFDDGQEVQGPEQATLGVLPADQGLGADHLARAHVDLGLVVKHEGVVVQRLADVGQAFVVPAHVAVGFGVEDVAAVLACQLGLVHGLVGLAQQLVGVDLFGLRVGGHADAGRDLHHGRADGDGPGRGREHARDDLQHLPGVFDVLHDGHEFVTAQAGQRVALAQGLAQALGHGHQQLVTDGMAVPVVDVLEAVEVEVDDGQLLAAPTRLPHRLVQPVGQQDAVGQAGQRVVVGVEVQLLLVLLELGDVREQRQVLPGHALLVAHGADGGHAGIVFATLAPVPDLAHPVPLVDELAPQVGVEGPVLPARFQEARVLPQRFFACVAGDASEGLVDIDDAPAGVGDHDALAGVREHAGGQVQPLFGLHALEREAHERGGQLDQAQVCGRRLVGFAVVDREGAEHLPPCRQDGLRPARREAGLLGERARQRPQGAAGDVLDDDPLARVHGGAAAAHVRPDGQAMNGFVVEVGQAGCCAVLQHAAGAVEQQDAAQAGGHQFLDTSHDGVEQGGQAALARQHLQDAAAEMLEAFGLLGGADVGDGADHAHRCTLRIALDDRAPADDPQLIAIWGVDAVLAGEQARLAREVALQCFVHARAVIGVDELGPDAFARASPFVTGGGLCRWREQDARDGDRVGGQVPVPHAVAHALDGALPRCGGGVWGGGHGARGGLEREVWPRLCRKVHVDALNRRPPRFVVTNSACVQRTSNSRVCPLNALTCPNRFFASPRWTIR